MRVGISTSVIQRGKTGIAQYLFALVRAMVRLPSPPELVLYVLAEDRPLFDPVRKEVTIREVDEIHRPPVRNILWHQRQLPAWAREDALDVLHVPSYRRMVAHAGCARVATIHDLAPFHVRGKYDWKRMLYGRVLVRWLAGKQDRIITISDFSARDIRRFFKIPENRLHLIHNGLEHARFHMEVTPGRPDCPGLGDSPFFLFVSRLEHPAKNHTGLIEAYEKHRASAAHHDWKLVLAGGDWHGAEVIHQRASTSPFARDILFPGFVRDEDLAGLYRAAGAMVYPSHFEGFGMPPLEAMACGCPVLSSTGGALGEVVGDAARTFSPSDIQDMTQAMNECVDQPEHRNNWVRKGLERAAKFRWDTCANSTLEVYRAASNDSPVAP